MTDEEVLEKYCADNFADCLEIESMDRVKSVVKDTIGFRSYLLSFRMHELINEINGYIMKFSFTHIFFDRKDEENEIK